MDTNEALTALLSNLRQKFNHYNSIMNTTKDLLELSDGRDPDSFGILLNMRESSMAQVDKLDHINGEIVAKLPPSIAPKIKECLWPSGVPITLDNPLQTSIFDTSKRNNQLLLRIIELDSQLTKRINPRRG
ncbi:MAG: hypothetical protein FWE66_02330 [Oscillospiraceae bacterium]|nr:hypothetical protein [Oscillospiraceae bacterium]